MNNSTQELDFTVNLSFEAHRIAKDLVSQIYHPEKRKQVYLNSLSVYAVDNYLRCMGVKTDYSEGDSRNPLVIQLMNVADLIVKDVGKLECVPVISEMEVVEIPPEVWEGRIGYVFVKLDNSLKKARILGFVAEAVAEVCLAQIRSFSDFLVYLTELEVVESVRSEERLATSNIINFKQWLNGVVDSSWQKIDDLLKPQQLGLAFKNELSITRGQKIDLGISFEKITVA